jgi:hypothetical protein
MNKHEKAFFDEWCDQTDIELVPQYRLVVNEFDLKPNEKDIRARIKETGFKDWRFDFAIPRYRYLIELNGIGTGHFAIKGYKDDMFKYRVAAMLDWRVFPFMSSDVVTRPDIAVEFVLESIELLEN